MIFVHGMENFLGFVPAEQRIALLQHVEEICKPNSPYSPLVQPLERLPKLFGLVQLFDLVSHGLDVFHFPHIITMTLRTLKDELDALVLFCLHSPLSPSILSLSDLLV